MNQIHPIVSFKSQIDALDQRGDLPLPDSVPFKSFRNAAVVAVTDNPSLLNGDRTYLFKALRTLASIGLVPDGREATIVSYGGKPQALPMVWGIVKVVKNTGKVKSIWPEVVYEGEKLNIWIEDGERRWEHVREDGTPLDAMSRGGEIRGAYAVAKMTDGSVEFQAMTVEQIEKRRRASSNQKGPKPSGVWEKWYEEQAQKTVIKNLAKRLPMSAEDMERLMAEDDTQPIRDITPEDDAPKKRQTLAEKILADDRDVASEDHQTGPDDGMIEGTAFEFDEDAVDPMTDEYDEGFKASQAAMREDMNPGKTFEEWNNWLGGFRFHASHREENDE